MILTEPDIRTAFARRLRLPQLELFVDRATRAVKLRGDVSVLLTGDKQIRRWKRDFRSKNKPTDVLSFPAAPIEGADGPVPAPIAGDLAISVETAERQAAEHGHSLVEELKVLLLHGVLHLAGYDHETDNGEMARIEQRLRVKLGLKSALIERAHTPAARNTVAAVRPARKPAVKKRNAAAAAKKPSRKRTVPRTAARPSKRSR